ncbi:transposable element Tcb1 transposase [Trichonephila clavipes]|nr:transposable element Tcb1 transposase [Trichonephila clavipes]
MITDSNLVLLNTTVPTYRSSAGAASLIDLTVCSSSMSGYCNSYVLDCSFESDHSPIITELSLLNSNKRIFKKTARGGRVTSTTPAEDRYIVLSSKRNRRTTAQQVANQFLAASGKQISRKTVARRLRGGGLYARRPVVYVLLTRQHHTTRLQWCREHHNWTEQDWACVLFSDESRFSLSSDCKRQLIWRESGTAYRPENIQEKTDIRHAVSWCRPAS